jgi:hypothetical protein
VFGQKKSPKTCQEGRGCTKKIQISQGKRPIGWGKNLHYIDFYTLEIRHQLPETIPLGNQ